MRYFLILLLALMTLGGSDSVAQKPLKFITPKDIELNSIVPKDSASLIFSIAETDSVIILPGVLYEIDVELAKRLLNTEITKIFLVDTSYVYNYIIMVPQLTKASIEEKKVEDAWKQLDTLLPQYKK